MRVFMKISIIFIFLIAVGVIYTRWDTQKWIENQPPPPAPALEKTQQDTSVVVSDVTEDVSPIQSDLSIAHNSSVRKTEDSSYKESPEVPIQRNIDTQRNDYNWQADFYTHATEHSHEHESDPWKPAEKGDGEGRQVITTEQLRVQLVDRFGDIPEVHTYVEMEEKIKERGSLTFDEMLMYAQSMNYLFPSPASEEAIKTLLQFGPGARQR